MCDHIFNCGEKSIPGEKFLEKIRPVYDVDIINVLRWPRHIPEIGKFLYDSGWDGCIHFDKSEIFSILSKYIYM